MGDDSMNRISVIIPCYNHGAYLDEAVDSVLAQNYGEVEIIIVNDGSTDTFTDQLLRSYDRPGCQVIHTPNGGLPSARNTGIKSSSGEYICCLDADDKYHPDYFGKAAQVFDSDEDHVYGAVAPWVRFFGTTNSLWKTVGSNIQGFSPHLQGVRNNFQSPRCFAGSAGRKQVDLMRP